MCFGSSNPEKRKSARKLLCSIFCCMWKSKQTYNHYPSLSCRKCKKSVNSKRSICLEHQICSDCLKSDSISLAYQNEIISDEFDCICIKFMKSTIITRIIQQTDDKSDQSTKSKYERLGEDCELKSNDHAYFNRPSNKKHTKNYEKCIPSIEDLHKNFYSVNQLSEVIESRTIKFDDEYSKEIDFSIPENDKSISIINQLLLTDNYCSLTPKCNKCQKTNNVKGFICNHNFCVNCLSLAYAKTVLHFRINYTEETDQNLKFVFFCPVKDCNQALSVPCMMIITSIRRLLEDDQFKNENQHYLFFQDESFDKWIPFFDGINLFAVYS